jgi:hypothetical protein
VRSGGNEKQKNGPEDKKNQSRNTQVLKIRNQAWLAIRAFRYYVSLANKSKQKNAEQHYENNANRIFETV